MLLAIAGAALLLGITPPFGVLAAIGLAGWMLTCVIWWATRARVAGIFCTVTGTAVFVLGGFLFYQDIGGVGFAALPLGVLGAGLTITGSLLFAQRSRRTANAWGAAAAVLVFLVSFFVVYPVCARFGLAKAARGVGPITERSEFPDELQDLLAAAEREGIKIEELDVFCQYRGDLDEEWYWKMKASPELIELATSLWYLSASDKSISQIQGSWQRVPSSHVAPVTNETQLYVSSGGYVPFVVHDKTDQRLYCHYMYDF